MKAKAKSYFKIFLKIGIAFALLYWLVAKGVLRLEDLKELMKGPILLIGAGIIGFNLFFMTLRWLKLMRARGIEVSFVDCFKLEIIGIFFNFALPGGVGGDLVKGFYLVKDQSDKKVDAAISVLMDRIIGLYSMIIMALLALLFHFESVVESVMLRSLGGMVLLAFIIATFGLLFGVSNRVRSHDLVEKLLERAPGGDMVRKVYDGFQAYRNHLSVLGVGILLSLLAQSCTVFFFYLVGQSLGPELPMVSYFFSVPLSMIVSAIPLAPAGIGVGQVAMAGFLGLFTEGAERLGAVTMTAFQVCVLGWGVLGMFAYLQRGKVKITENSEVSV